MEGRKGTAGQLECSPDPLGGGVGALHLNLLDPTAVIGHHRIKKLGPGDRKQQKGKLSVRQQLKTFEGKPDRVRQTYKEFVLGSDKRAGAKQRVAESVG